MAGGNVHCIYINARMKNDGRSTRYAIAHIELINSNEPLVIKRDKFRDNLVKFV